MNASYLLLGFVVLPLWIAAGLADYLCHRASHISLTSGVLESILHLIQFALVGIPVTLALFLEANAGFFLFACICILLHHLIAYIDVRYANGTRKVEPLEQMVHSFLEVLPITALLLLATAEWGQFLVLLKHWDAIPVFVLRQPISGFYAAMLLTTAFLFNFVPYIEELWRCLEARNKE